MKRVAAEVNLNWARTHNLYGRGVGIAIIDTGIFLHPDFLYRRNRIAAFHDVLHHRIAIYDDNGHGTHTAGIAAGTGQLSDGAYCGIAPGADLIIIKALNQGGGGSVPDVIHALEWIDSMRYRYNIRIINISIGSKQDKMEPAEEQYLIDQVEHSWDSGLIVIAAAGNHGPEDYTIGAPGNSRKIITVGASDDEKSIYIDGQKIRNYSSRGPTASCVLKPDIVAPGSGIKSCNAGFKQGHPSTYYTIKSGTSMATPIVSGGVALLLQKYPDMTPREVKIRLKNRAIDLGKPHTVQGWGKLDLKELLR